MDRFVFLDFDGVVCTDKTYDRWTRAGKPSSIEGLATLFDPVLVGRVNEICTLTESKIIASTAWRRPSICPYPLSVLIPLVGFTAELVGQTPDMGPVSKRGHEISSYVSKEGLSLEQFVILDDNNRAGSVPRGALPIASRWVQTSSSDGISPKNVNRAVSMFLFHPEL